MTAPYNNCCRLTAVSDCRLDTVDSALLGIYSSERRSQELPQQQQQQRTAGADQSTQQSRRNSARSQGGSVAVVDRTSSELGQASRAREGQGAKGVYGWVACIGPVLSPTASAGENHSNPSATAGGRWGNARIGTMVV